MVDKQSETWQEVEKWVKYEREEYTRLLIACENEEYRGRIKQLDDLLESV